MYVVVGLGNPGKQYDKTRHNVGFDVIDILAKEYGISVTKIKHKALIGEGRIGCEKVLLVKPQTYMNLSGETLIDIYKYYKVDLSNIIVVYDDIDPEIAERLCRISLQEPDRHSAIRLLNTPMHVSFEASNSSLWILNYNVEFLLRKLCFSSDACKLH